MTETEAIRENYNLGVLAGEAREQQRIIKLLETLNNPSIPLGELYLTIQEVGEIAALIKGEK